MNILCKLDFYGPNLVKGMGVNHRHLSETKSIECAEGFVMVIIYSITEWKEVVVSYLGEGTLVCNFIWLNNLFLLLCFYCNRNHPSTYLVWAQKPNFGLMSFGSLTLGQLSYHLQLILSYHLQLIQYNRQDPNLANEALAKCVKIEQMQDCTLIFCPIIIQQIDS